MVQLNSTALKEEIQNYLWIFVASILYGIGTSAFIFPSNITLGGTSGISVILTSFLEQSESYQAPSVDFLQELG